MAAYAGAISVHTTHFITNVLLLSELWQPETASFSQKLMPFCTNVLLLSTLPAVPPLKKNDCNIGAVACNF